MRHREVLGKRTEAWVHDIDEGQIRRFAAAMGLADPLHVDERLAMPAEPGGLVAPFSFPLLLRSRVDLHELFPASEHTLVPASRTLEVFRPIRAGDTIGVVGWIAALSEQGAGKPPVLRATVQEEGRDEDECLVFRSEVTVLVRPREGKRAQR